MVTLATFFLLGRAVSPGAVLDAWGGDWFAFVVVGLAVQEPLYAALTEGAARLREARLVGTLEAVLVTPISPTRMVVLSTVTPVLGGVARGALVLGVGAAALGVRLDPAGLPLAVVTLAVAVVASLALGLLGASFTLVFKRGDPVSSLLHVGSALLGGVLYPVDVLPESIRGLAEVIPLTHALGAVRAALLPGAAVDGTVALARLVGLTLVLVPIAWWVFRRAAARARAEGSLGFY